MRYLPSKPPYAQHAGQTKRMALDGRVTDRQWSAGVCVGPAPRDRKVRANPRKNDKPILTQPPPPPTVEEGGSWVGGGTVETVTKRNERCITGKSLKGGTTRKTLSMAVLSRFGAMTLRGLSAYRYAPL